MINESFEFKEPLINTTRSSNHSYNYPQKELTNNTYDYEIDKYSTSKSCIESLKSMSSFPDELIPKYYKCEKISFCTHNFLKSLVSKNKIRMQRRTYDLDLVYITKRVIAMGYPAESCESFYRNSWTDVRKFWNEEHSTNYKVYNLCLESNRIYTRMKFPGNPVALFPFEDHQACPVKLMLEFCVDVTWYLLSNPDSVAAVHCKAGKGRTGIMICSYLIFTGIAMNSTKAFEFYGERRSVDNKGINVPSQRRYVHHFETYWNCNFERPFYKMIPTINEKYLTPPNGNWWYHVFTDKGYYDHKNIFKIKKIKIGPFLKRTNIICQILNFKSQSRFNTGDKMGKIHFKTITKEEHEPWNKENLYYFIIDIIDNLFIDSDINIKIDSSSFTFNAWINLFYITLENFIYLVNTQFNDHNIIMGSTNFFYSNTKTKTLSKINFLEMNDLSSCTTKNNQITHRVTSQGSANSSQHLQKMLFIRSYDANFFCDKNITLDGKKIKNFLKNKTKYKGDHIQTYDLNNIYEYMNKENSNWFDSKRKKFKIKMDKSGLDNVSNISLWHEKFSIDITYYLN